MADADGDAGLAAQVVGRSRRPRRQVLLAFVAFLLLFGQPAVVFALAMTAASPASLAVIVAGTALLAVPATRLYVGKGWSVSRLADYVIAVALVQVGFVLLSRATLAGGDGELSSVVQPAIVVVSYPIVYLVLTRGVGR